MVPSASVRTEKYEDESDEDMLIWGVCVYETIEVFDEYELGCGY
jgi:hypothetical protein